MHNSIQANLLTIRKIIIDTAQQYHRTPQAVQLLAVSKGQSIDKIQTAIKAGQIAFGESYLQEAIPKIEICAKKNLGNLEWHFIGHIQSNKCKAIATNFNWVHSISSLSAAQKLDQNRPSNLPLLNICLQINISQEPNKHGINPEQITTLATKITSLPRLRLRGLMCIPAMTNTFNQQRIPFKQCQLLLQTLQQKFPHLDTLSMGMSKDLTAAIAEGATWVRIGTAIFGNRR